jgi:hypothetical protein
MKNANSYLLIAGSPRSGTTLLASTLNSIPDIAVFAEFSLSKIIIAIEAMFNAMEDYQFAPYDPGAVEQFLRPTRSEHRNDLLRRIWSSVYPDKIIRVLGNKIPSVAAFEQIDFLLESLPNLKIIYTLRNCPETVASALKRNAETEHSGGWLLSTERDTVWEWTHSLLIGQYIGRRSENILYVKYEDLITGSSMQAFRIMRFLETRDVAFTIRPGGSEKATTPRSLAEFPEDANVLVAQWDELSAEQIGNFDLAATRSFVCKGWWPTGLPLCDVETLTNFHAPEPWGVWSRPGYFALSPRFMLPDASVAAVEIVLENDLDTVTGGRPVAFINSRAGSIATHADGNSRTVLTIYPEAPLSSEKLIVEVFSTTRVRFDGDQRFLGLAVSRYRVVWATTDG